MCPAVCLSQLGKINPEGRAPSGGGHYRAKQISNGPEEWGLERDISRYMTWAREGQKFTIPVCLAPGAWRVPLQMLLPPQILVHSHLPRLGCLKRELCFKTGEAILKSHVLPKARRGQHNNWAGSSFPLVFSHYVPPAMNQAQAVVWPSS